MKKFLILGLLLAFVAAGCGQQAEEVPVDKAPEQEKTPEQIYEQINKDLGKLNGVKTGGLFFDAEKAETISKLRGHKATYQAKENGVIALDRVRGDIEGVIAAAKDGQRWRIVLNLIEVYDVIQPGSSKYLRLKSQAELQLKRPRVKLKGFFEDVNSNNQLYAFVTIIDPVAGKTYNEQMREGEVKYGIRFNRIIGNKQGVEFEYLAIPGDLFTVMKPGA